MGINVTVFFHLNCGPSSGRNPPWNCPSRLWPRGVSRFHFSPVELGVASAHGLPMVGYTAWCLSPTPLKNDGLRQLGSWHSQLNGKIIQMSQTTNQYIIPGTIVKSPLTTYNWNWPCKSSDHLHMLGYWVVNQYVAFGHWRYHSNFHVAHTQSA